MKRRLELAITMTVVAVALGAVATVVLWWPSAAMAAAEAAAVPPDAVGWAFASAAIAAGLAALGAGIAVANVGAAAIGAIAEKPELFGRMLILVGLAEGIAIYGLIVSILILDRLG
jgi:V/A-type H+-transporting ATPase subunit K